jgi:hypothetical protein
LNPANIKLETKRNPKWMTRRIGYSYLYSKGSGDPPSWFTDNMQDYMERFLPSYVSKYLHVDILVEPASYASVLVNQPTNWIDYLASIRDQVTWGYDSFVVLVDSPYEVISPECLCAGQNYYLADPNFAWTSVRNWNLVKQVARENGGSYLRDERFAEMAGNKSDPGIDCLATAGHELLHFVLLSIGGANLSEQIDGGALAGMSFLDYALNPVSCPNLLFPNFRYVAQRISPSLPCQSPLGAYGCFE